MSFKGLTQKSKEQHSHQAPSSAASAAAAAADNAHKLVRKVLNNCQPLTLNCPNQAQ